MPRYKYNLLDDNYNKSNESLYPSPTEIRGLGFVWPKDEHDGNNSSGTSGSSSIKEALHRMVRGGSVDDVINTMKSCDDNFIHNVVNGMDDDKMLTPLHYAARYTSIEMVRLLIDLGADVNKRGNDDMTALHYAARHRIRETLSNNSHSEVISKQGHSETVLKCLLDNGASINSQDCFGLTALHYACMRSNVLEVSQLLAYRPIAEVPDNQRMTPLHLAVVHAPASVTRMLVRSGCCIETKDEKGQTPLHKASMEGKVEIVSCLLDFTKDKGDGFIEKLNCIQDIDGNTALHLGILYDSADVVECILSHTNVSVMIENKNCPPLHTASSKGNSRIVQSLMLAGVEANVLDKHFNAPLHVAAASGHENVICDLLRNGADIEKRNKKRHTPLLFAIIHGKTGVVKRLLECDANVLALDAIGHTALCLAAKKNYPDMGELLKDRRFSSLVNVGNDDGNTPLHLAATYGHNEVARLLLKSGSNSVSNYLNEKPIHKAVKYNNFELLQILLNYDPTKKMLVENDENGDTPLHIAASKGHKSVFHLLLNAGSNVHALNMELFTPLDSAAAAGESEIVRMILEKYPMALENYRKRKTTPLHLAASEGHANVIEVLLEWGADVTCKDGKGCNVLETAIISNEPHIAATLIKSEQWREALSCHSVTYEGLKNSPFRMLIRQLPEVASLVLDRCISSTSLPVENKDFQVTFDFSFVDDTYGDFMKEPVDPKSLYQPYSKDAEKVKDNHPLMIMKKERQHELLSHPVCCGLVIEKWRRLGRLFGTLLFLLYCLFLLSFSYFFVHVLPLHAHSEVTSIPKQASKPLISKWAIVIFAFGYFLKQVVWAFLYKSIHIDAEKVLVFTCCVGSTIFALDFTDFSEVTGRRQDWQWQIGTAAIFLSWLRLIILAGKLPVFGIYILMVTTTMKTVSKFLIVFLLFRVAFGLGFHMLLQGDKAFSSPLRSIFKVSVMMMGDLDYATISNASAYCKGVVYMFFITFIVISFVTMNLLIGLAVNDIEAIRKDSMICRIITHVQFALNIELHVPVPSFLKSYMVSKKYEFCPNKRNFIYVIEDKMFKKQVKKHLERIRETEKKN